jgi:hypothetical protein
MASERARLRTGRSAVGGRRGEVSKDTGLSGALRFMRVDRWIRFGGISTIIVFLS